MAIEILTVINSALTGVKTATEIAKYVKDAGTAFDEADFKLKMAELLIALAESQSALAESTQSISEKEEEIKKLQDLLKFSSKIQRFNNAYFELDPDNKLIGDPYCQHCWEARQMAVHLTYVNRSEFKCPSCKNTYHAGMVRLPDNA